MINLTKQEDQIMELYTIGYSCQEISQELNMSIDKINYYISDIYDKLNQKNKHK